jgi:hypothetical protein
MATQTMPPTRAAISQATNPVTDRLSPAEARRLVEAMSRSRLVSKSLRAHLVAVAIR